MYFPLDEYHARWQRVYASLEALGLESAVVWSRGAGTHEKCADVLYLTNYYSNQSGHCWERPTIWLDAKQGEGYAPLFAGQVLGIETFLCDPEVGSVGVEQNLIVGAAGNELLTTTPLEWW